MTALIERLDVDAVQWRALVRASLRVDFAALRGAHGMTGARRMAAELSLTLLIYLLGGLAPAVAVGTVPDILFGATVMTTFVAFMVMSSLLVGEGATIVSPSDHHILGFRPVTSRTYLAVRVTSLAIRTMVIATCVALPSVLVYLFKDEFHPGRAVAALVAAYGAGLAITLGIVAMYGWLLRVAGPRRMIRYASYTQFAAQMVAWGGFIVVTQGLGRRALAGLSLSDSVWALAYPGTWFGSYVALASGHLSWMTIASTLLSIGLVLVLARAIGGKLSLGYAESLGRLTTVAAPQTAHGGGVAMRWLGLLNDETRAVAILVRSQLQHDMKFRLGIISLLPMTIVYMYMGGSPADPFVASVKKDDGSLVIMMALLFLPTTLLQLFVGSDAYRASWIFHTTPANRAKLVLATRNIITLFFLVPYLVCLAALFAYSFKDAGHAIVHATFIGLLSYLVLQFIVMMNPRLPFSLPHNKETQSARLFGLMIAATIAGVVLYAALKALVYKTGIGMAVGAAVAVAAAYAMDRITRRRVAKRMVQMFEAS